MISDASFEKGVTISDKTIGLIQKLLDPKILSTSLDPYIISMVNAYIRKKEQITISITGLDAVQEAISGLVIEDKIEELNTSDWNPGSLSSSRINLISPKLISLFPNVKRITIKTSGSDKFACSYPFSMVYFLQIISKISNCELIKIQQIVDDENEDNSWINRLWRQSQQELKAEYGKQQYHISFDTEKQESQGSFYSSNFFIVSPL